MPLNEGRGQLLVLSQFRRRLLALGGVRDEVACPRGVTAGRLMTDLGRPIWDGKKRSKGNHRFEVPQKLASSGLENGGRSDQKE